MITAKQVASQREAVIHVNRVAFCRSAATIACIAAEPGRCPSLGFEPSLRDGERMEPIR